jgi:hypothetical protein
LTTIAADRPRLIFTCCHPALAAEARVALTLQTLGGLGTGEIARAFLVSEATMAQRLVRAKQKIRRAGIPIPPHERTRDAGAPAPPGKGRATRAPPHMSTYRHRHPRRNLTMASSIDLAVSVNAAPGRITDALATADGLASFWTADSHAEPQPGSVARFGFGGPELEMRVDQLDPGRRVAWTCLSDFPMPRATGPEPP